MASSILREGNDGRSGPLTLRILNDLRVARLHDGDARVRGAEIDANDAIVDKKGARISDCDAIRDAAYLPHGAERLGEEASLKVATLALEKVGQHFACDCRQIVKRE